MTNSTTPNTPANGGQILTWQERIVDGAFVSGARDQWFALTGASAAIAARDAEIADLRALAAAPASEPVKAVPKYLPPPELTWLYTHCRAIGMTCKSLSGKWEHDIALFTINLQNEIETAKAAAPAPVSGMPDLAIPHNFTTHRDSWREAITEAINNAGPATVDSDQKGYWQHELEAFDRAFDELLALPSRQAPDTPNPTGETK